MSTPRRMLLSIVTPLSTYCTKCKERSFPNETILHFYTLFVKMALIGKYQKYPRSYGASMRVPLHDTTSIIIWNFIYRTFYRIKIRKLVEQCLTTLHYLTRKNFILKFEFERNLKRLNRGGMKCNALNSFPRHTEKGNSEK